jgi:hypothetical protein
MNRRLVLALADHYLRWLCCCILHVPVVSMCYAVGSFLDSAEYMSIEGHLVGSCIHMYILLEAVDLDFNQGALTMSKCTE